MLRKVMHAYRSLKADLAHSLQYVVPTSIYSVVKFHQMTSILLNYLNSSWFWTSPLKLAAPLCCTVQMRIGHFYPRCYLLQ